MSQQQSMGLSIKISAELKDSLRNNNGGSAVPNKLVKLVPLSRRKLRGDEEEEEEEVKKEEEVNESIIEPIIPDKEEEEEEVGDENNEEENEASIEEEKPLVLVSSPRQVLLQDMTDDDDDDDELSDSPPPTLPVVIVHLEKLCGAEHGDEAVVAQVKSAFENEDDFLERVTQLLDLQMARHGETGEVVSLSNQKELQVSYPELLCPADGRVLLTDRVWKQLLSCRRQSHIVVVQRILHHLKNCNRCLVWKYDMQREVLNIVQREEAVRQETALHEWRGLRRKLELDRLYQVRETFCHRLEMAEIELEKLEDEREYKILQQQQECGGLQALDLATSTVFHVDENVKASDLLQVTGDGEYSDDDDDDDDCGSSSSSNSDDGDSDDASSSKNNDMDDIDDDDSGADDERSVGSNDAAAAAKKIKKKKKARSKSNDDATAKTEDEQMISKKKKRKGKLKKRRQLLAAQRQQARDKQRLEEALQEEERIRTQYTSQELRMAQAAVQSLQVRSQQVDDLLESLQDDEWEDEEEGYEATTVTNDDVKDDDDSEQLTLLDQILAMILGSLSPARLTSLDEEQHLRFVAKEHQEILKGWKSHFGRLPRIQQQAPAKPSPTTKQPPSLREEMGIVDNDGDWDQDDDGEAEPVIGPTTAAVKTTITTTTPSLRPGGSSLRPGGSVAK